MDELIFNFLEEEESLPSVFGCNDVKTFEEDENAKINDQKSKAFWQSQEEVLKAILYRTTSLESRIRQATKDIIKELRIANVLCDCKKSKEVNLCKNCLHKNISSGLQDAGFNCMICKSKWRSSPKIPSGEHTYMLVTHSSNQYSSKGEIKVIIELNFQSEFEMARASEEYNKLIKCVPEVYVGKIERLGALLKLLCTSSKKLLKERKMHMAPWRKQKYMEAKWLGGSSHHLVKLPSIGNSQSQSILAKVLMGFQEA